MYLRLYNIMPVVLVVVLFEGEMRSGREKTCPSSSMDEQIINSKTESLVVLTLVYRSTSLQLGFPLSLCSSMVHLHTPDYFNLICIDALIFCFTTINNVSMSDHITPLTIIVIVRSCAYIYLKLLCSVLFDYILP